MNVLIDGFYTKKQLKNKFKEWHVTEKPPQKGKKAIVCFPKYPGVTITVAEITLHWTAPECMYRALQGNYETIK